MCGMQASEIRWASRWDTYLLMMDDQIHWFSIINSLMIVLFLSGMVAMIMMRTLHRDISQYNQLDSAEEAQEETGWKLVSPPSISVHLLASPHTLNRFSACLISPYSNLVGARGRTPILYLL